MTLYFVWIWVWDDAELKVASIKPSSKGQDTAGQPTQEITELKPVSTSVTLLFEWLLGFSMLLWSGEKYAESDPAMSGDLSSIPIGTLSF
jgi:hypothetical protein